MANDQQLAILCQGIDGWNAWRKRNCNVRPDLERATLRDADLRRANLARANLAGANLVRADLAEANLAEAILHSANLFSADLRLASVTEANLRLASVTEANLAEADLRLANLAEANLAGANLAGANLAGAYLAEANLRVANMAKTNLRKVQLRDTVFADVDLSGTVGLETCEHLGPSIIDHRTLQRSGQLPLSFLRGCGLPDNVIMALPSLLDQSIEFYSCFISYSSMDGGFARRLHGDLQDRSIRCWFAPEDMKIGDRIRTRIDEVIHTHEKLLLVLSADSINSNWVEKEVEAAFEKERETKRTVLFPVRLDDAVMECKAGWAADIKRTRHIGDFRPWKNDFAYFQAFERLLRDLKVEPAA